jgi:hypothetical protein
VTPTAHIHHKDTKGTKTDLLNRKATKATKLKEDHQEGFHDEPVSDSGVFVLDLGFPSIASVKRPVSVAFEIFLFSKSVFVPFVSLWRNRV